MLPTRSSVGAPYSLFLGLVALVTISRSAEEVETSTATRPLPLPLDEQALPLRLVLDTPSSRLPEDSSSRDASFVPNYLGVGVEENTDGDEFFMKERGGSIQPPPECRSFHTNSSRYNLLACWLFYLKVKIPDQSFRKSFVTLHLKHLECTNFTIGTLESAYRPSHNATSSRRRSHGDGDDDSNPYLDLVIQNASAICHGHYDSSMGLSGHMTAQAVGVHHAVDLSMRLVSSSNYSNTNSSTSSSLMKLRRPKAVQTAACQTNLRVRNLRFTGSNSAKVVDLFSHTIAKYVSAALQGQLCPVLPSQVDPVLTQQLQKLNQWLDQYLQNEEEWEEDTKSFHATGPTRVKGESLMFVNNEAAATTAARRRQMALDQAEDGGGRPKDNLIDLMTDVPFLARATDWINRVALEPHLNQGFLPHEWWNSTLASKRRNQLNGDDDDDDTPCPRCGLFFDGWNGVVRSIWPEQITSGLNVALPPRWRHIRFVIPSYGAVELQLHNLTVVSGLDQWVRVQLLQIMDAQTLGTAVQTQNASVRTDLKVIVQAIPDGIFQGDDLEESFSINVNATLVGGILDMGVFLLRDGLESVKVKTLIDLVDGIAQGNGTVTRHALASLLPAVKSLQASTLALIVQLVHASFEPHAIPQAPPSNQQLERDLDAIVNNMLQLVLREYQPLVTAAIAGLTKGPAKDALNRYLDNVTTAELRQSTRNDCDMNRDAFKDDKPFNFTNGLLALNGFLARNETLSRINGHINCVSDFLSHVLDRKLSAGLTQFLKKHRGNKDDDDDNPFFQLLGFQLKDTGSIRKVQLLYPEKNGKYFESAVEYGGSSQQVRPRLVAAADMRYSPLNLSAEVQLELSLNDMRVTERSALTYDSSQLGRTGLLQLLEHSECAVAPSSLAFYNVSSSLGQFESLIQTSFSNPWWNETVNVTLNSRDYPSIGRAVSYSFSWMVTSIHDMFETTSRSVVDNAFYTCEGESPPDYDDDGLDYSSIFLVIGAVLLFAQPAFLLIKRGPDDIDEALLDEGEAGLQEPLLQGRERSMNRAGALSVEPEPCSTSESLMGSTKISYSARILVPMLILCTITLLLSSNLSVGATVDLVIRLDEERSFRSPPLFAFSLFNTAKEMFQARIYPLFFLVVVFSGIWPYVKLLLLLASWVAPTQVLSVQRRGKLLLALDSLGKFSLVDTYVLVLMLVAFRYHLDFFAPGESPDLDVFVTPQFGFFGFLAATTMSLLAGHILVFSHRRAELHVGDQTTPTEPLLEHSFLIDGERRQLSRCFQVLVLSIFVVTTCLFGVGITRESFVFEFGGLAGEALGGGDNGRSAYSLLSLGTSISESVENPLSPGILFLQLAYYFYAVVMPFGCLLSLCLLLTWPMTVHRQLTFITIAEITNAWSAVEVFVLSIVAALLEISTFAKFIIGNRCDLIEQILSDHRDEIGPTATTCYTVTSTVTRDSAFLIVAVVLNSAWVSFVLRFAHQALDERVRDLRDEMEGRDCLAVDDIICDRTLVARLADWKLTRWMIAPSMDVSLVAPLEEEEEEEGQDVGPPVLAQPTDGVGESASV